MLDYETQKREFYLIAIKKSFDEIRKQLRGAPPEEDMIRASVADAESLHALLVSEQDDVSKLATLHGALDFANNFTTDRCTFESGTVDDSIRREVLYDIEHVLNTLYRHELEMTKLLRKPRQQHFKERLR